MKTILLYVELTEESKKLIESLTGGSITGGMLPVSKESHDVLPVAQEKNEIQIANPEGRFYYVRNHNNHPVVTVYIERLNTMFWIRGTAICSKKDPINKATGRAIAYENAMKKASQIKNNRHIKTALSEEEQKKRFQRNMESPVLLETMNHYFPSFNDLFTDNDDDEYIKFRKYNFLELIEYKSKFISEKGLSLYERKLYGMGE